MEKTQDVWNFQRKKGTFLQTVKNKIVVFLTSILSITSGGSQALLITCSTATVKYFCGSSMEKTYLKVLR